MTKKVTETIEIGQDWFYKHTIKETIVELCALSNQYGDDAIISSEPFGYDGPEEYFVTYERDETSEERRVRLDNARITREKKAKRRSMKEEAERNEFERLKKKYG